ncbi:MAG: NADH-quinone oxidoreductase subunit I [Planctomycetes bacterium]|nr:NADH-quinone oxidoreductase subunit I [Planctomycetota bacterium]MCB9935810.1 NADH-quinone oxidoreductase subunit I [Planctomycetota bacterium]
MSTHTEHAEHGDVRSLMTGEKPKKDYSDERKLNFWERIYLIEIVKGLVNTFKMMFRPSTTIDYVGEKSTERQRHVPAVGYRGEHYLKVDDKNNIKCVACFMCSTACPAECITIVGDATDVDQFGAQRFKAPEVFEIDMLKCIYCGMCVEACPKDAIAMSTTYNQVGTKRGDFIYDKARLLKNNDEFMESLGLARSGKDKDGRYPLSPAGMGPDVTHGLQPFRQGTRSEGA